MILADTNILLRSVHPHYSLAKNVLMELRIRSESLCLAPQNLVEFWAVATRPRNENGFGLTATQAASELRNIQDFFRLLLYTPQVVEKFKEILLAQGVSGKQTHDAHLVAVMQVHSVTSILTFNEEDFKRYPGITVLNPAAQYL
ncbi:MAG: type II toxin-antitoxin system VapC family toxin [Acidobacteriaceae bacterium]|nr:type II toxin-antitoxin system VapC family toxin [Acidobacteriaceae bacterium]MBV9767029.1 type II toxin-antitoxin system VapC family toxin [Acidobacteriaceae bacterium]